MLQLPFNLLLCKVYSERERRMNSTVVEIIFIAFVKKYHRKIREQNPALHILLLSNFLHISASLMKGDEVKI